MTRKIQSRANLTHRWLPYLLILFLLLIPQKAVRADPPDMYAQNLAVRLGSAGLLLDWRILPGPVISDAAWQSADQNQDGTVSADEASAWLAPYIQNLSLSMDGQTIPGIVQSVHWPATVDVLRTGEDSIEVQLFFQLPASLSGTHAIVIHNSHFESNSLNWYSLAGQDGFAFDTPAQNNGQLKFNFYVPGSTGSTPSPGTRRLTSWTSGTPNLPLFTDTVSKMASNLASSAPGGPASGSSNQPTSVASALTALVKTQEFSPFFLAGAFLLSLVLGSLHGLTPGHGKALVGAYLVGSQGRARDAVFLGLIVTLTHTGSVLLLGLITLIASHYILPTLITPWLEIISGLLVIAFGINLFLGRRAELNSDRPAHAAESSVQTHRSATHVHPHSHGDSGEPVGHTHPHDQHSRRVTWKSLLTLGISGGLVPCPDAIAILLVAVAINRIPFGMLLILSFSIGLALILILIGLAMVGGARLIARSDLLTRFSLYTPLVSAVVVTGLGAALTISAINSFQFVSKVSQSASSSIAGGIDHGRPSGTAGQNSWKVLFIAPAQQTHDQLFSVPFSGGSPVQLTQEPSGIVAYSISPDDKTIIYVVFQPDNDGSAIWTMNLDGSGKRLALDCPHAQCDSPQWYPDSQKVAYERLDNSQTVQLPRFSIWWLDLSTGVTQPVFQDQSFPGTSPKFSPDGQWLSYISAVNNMLMLYHLRDNQSISIPLRSAQTIPEAWSPAGNEILYGDQTDLSGSTFMHVKEYGLTSGQTTDLGGSGGQSDYSGVWSPDGDWIAIDRDSAANGPTTSNQVWLVQPDGTGAHIFLNESDVSYSSLGWSPDGSELIYSRYSYQFAYQNSGHFDIYGADVQTGKQTLLAAGGDLATIIP